MAVRGGHHALAAAGPPAPDGGPDGAAPGYRSGAALPLRVEIGRQLRRRRTLLTFLALLGLPVLIALAFEVGADPDSGTGTQLVDLATAGAGNLTLFTLLVATGFPLVVIFALFAGDTVSSEASWSSLRYLLTAPVPRGRLLRQKLLVALGSCALALIVLIAAAYVAGGLFFGWDPVRTPLGESLSGQATVGRLALAGGYLFVTLLFTASLAFLLGVLTDAPLGAVGGAVLLVIVSSILDAVTALGDLRKALPTHYAFAWTDLLSTPIPVEAMTRGVLWSLGYSTVLLWVAWWRFLRKDIVS